MVSYGKVFEAESDGQTISDPEFDYIGIEMSLSIFL